jgi:hypothetical protein
MPAVLADTPVANLLDEWTVERVRAARRQATDAELCELVGRLEYLDRAIVADNRAAIENIIMRSTPGPVRRCLADLAAHHLALSPIDLWAGPAAKPDKTQRRDRPYTELAAMVAPVDTWASTGYRHLTIDADAFAGINQNRRSHEPVGLLWRHRSAPIGLSRHWRVDDNGNLHGEFWMPNTREAQLVAAAAADRLIYPSVGVRFESDWVHPLPDEWDPYDGTLDVCVHRWAQVAEVSMTPNPQLPTNIEHVW